MEFVIQRFDAESVWLPKENILSRFPQERRVPPFYQSFFDEDMPSALAAAINRDTDLDPYAYNVVFSLDTNNDYKNEWILINSTLFDGWEILVVDETSTHLLSKGDAELPILWGELGLYPSQNSNPFPFIVLGGYLGARGAYATGEIYQWNGSEYEFVMSGVQGNGEPDELKAIRRELGILGSDE